MDESDPLQRFRQQRCRQCEYDLRGTWELELCPECGVVCDATLVVQPDPGLPAVGTNLGILMAVFLGSVLLCPLAALSDSMPIYVGFVIVCPLCLIALIFYIVARRRRMQRLELMDAIITRREIGPGPLKDWTVIPWTAVLAVDVTPLPPRAFSLPGEHPRALLQVRHRMDPSNQPDAYRQSLARAGHEATLTLEFACTAEEARAMEQELRARLAAAQEDDDRS